ncbi:ATP-binding protein [Actinosynnema sp. ALI-1.44]|uniref:sensor histidine kinase n=1 Tax=Actinosynnema sp. ALI-1.44 TaxID=1933779 RepID=UPI00097C4DF5|nr:histidine kinase [Actinosynnema sp. ALI-1.44]ONI90092.1 ATP-binding protein [Actinosynnema sp. ALI-1.44]
MWHLGEGWLAVAVLACLAAVFFAVRLARAERAHTRAVQERGWLLERERQTAADSAVDAERARIARELHDIVSHNVSVMVVQAGAARRVLATETDEATDALLAVETAGRDTMTELRHMLGLLSPAVEGDEVDRLSPQPGLSRLSSLVDRISFAGLPVEVRVSGKPVPLPSGVDLTAYRVVQEALTNALKHGDGRKAEVTVRYAEHYLRVEVLNSGPSVLSGTAVELPADPGEGRGLLGLRERVAVLGGDLDARRRLGGGFRVRAKIPIEQS